MAHKPGHKKPGTRLGNLLKHSLKIINPGSQDTLKDTYSKSDLQRLRKIRERNKNKSNNKNKIYKTSNRPNPKQDEINKANKNIENAKGWNKKQLKKKKEHLEKFGKSRTWSNPVGAEGKGKPSTVDTSKSTAKKKGEPSTVDTSKSKKKSKWIRTSKGTLAKRGSVSARGAERKEAARKKVQDLARKRIAAKKNKLKV